MAVGGSYGMQGGDRRRHEAAIAAWLEAEAREKCAS
jgi:hypothetical protein